MTDYYSEWMNRSSAHASEWILLPAGTTPGGMSHARNEKSPAAIGQRLLITRTALGFKQNTFAERAGLTNNLLSQLEKGKYRPALDTAIALCEEYNLTLDWIYFGDGSNLPSKLWDAIRALRQSQQTTAPRNKPSLRADA